MRRCNLPWRKVVLKKGRFSAYFLHTFMNLYSVFSTQLSDDEVTYLYVSEANTDFSQPIGTFRAKSWAWHLQHPFKTVHVDIFFDVQGTRQDCSSAVSSETIVTIELSTIISWTSCEWRFPSLPVCSSGLREDFSLWTYARSSGEICLDSFYT